MHGVVGGVSAGSATDFALDFCVCTVDDDLVAIGQIAGGPTCKAADNLTVDCASRDGDRIVFGNEVVVWGVSITGASAKHRAFDVCTNAIDFNPVVFCGAVPAIATVDRACAAIGSAAECAAGDGYGVAFGIGAAACALASVSGFFDLAGADGHGVVAGRGVCAAGKSAIHIAADFAAFNKHFVLLCRNISNRRRCTIYISSHCAAFNAYGVAAVALIKLGIAHAIGVVLPQFADVDRPQALRFVADR